MNMGRYIAILGVMILWLVPAGKNHAEDSSGQQIFQDQFRDIASELRCPTCVGLSVLESDAPFSKQIKSEVTEQLQAGKSGDEILKFFTDRYGPWILRAPPKEGINVLAWGIPLALLITGPFFVWFFIWRHRDTVTGAESIMPIEDILAAWEQDIAQARSSVRDGKLTQRGEV